MTGSERGRPGVRRGGGDGSLAIGPASVPPVGDGPTATRGARRDGANARRLA